MKKAKFKFSAEISETTGLNPIEWVYTQLIKQKNIDVDYYNIQLIRIDEDSSANDFQTKSIYVTYRLLRSELADDIDELQERINGAL